MSCPLTLGEVGEVRVIFSATTVKSLVNSRVTTGTAPDSPATARVSRVLAKAPHRRPSRDLNTFSWPNFSGPVDKKTVGAKVYWNVTCEDGESADAQKLLFFFFFPPPQLS